jgi:hypothetical protein
MENQTTKLKHLINTILDVELQERLLTAIDQNDKLSPLILSRVEALRIYQVRCKIFEDKGFHDIAIQISDIVENLNAVDDTQILLWSNILSNSSNFIAFTNIEISTFWGVFFLQSAPPSGASVRQS